MTNSIPLSDMESSPSAKFAAVGDKYAGTIRAITQRQQTDPNTGQVKYWQDGSPRMVWVITLALADGDSASLWAAGGNYKPQTGTGESMLAAIATAVRAAGAQNVEVGAELAIAHTGLGVPTSPGLNAPKLYTAQYRPPAPVAQQVSVDDLFN